MNSDELKAARERLGLSQSELSEAIRTPKRTIQDWEAGKCRLPGIVGVCMGMLEQQLNLTMAVIRLGIESRVESEHPRGIPTVLRAEERGE